MILFSMELMLLRVRLMKAVGKALLTKNKQHYKNLIVQKNMKICGDSSQIQTQRTIKR